MNSLLFILLISIPLISFTNTAIRNWKVVKWIHYDIPREQEMKKKTTNAWRMKDGSFIRTSSMSDIHLANAIRMLARLWLGAGHDKESFLKSPSLKELMYEATKRKFQTHIPDEPYILNGKIEYIIVFQPDKSSKLSISFYPAELDSRSQV